MQDLLVRMLGNVTASKCRWRALRRCRTWGGWRRGTPHSKASCTVRMRETVAWARELMGGNDILLDHDMGRFVADAEAIYSCEGARGINTLVVGRAITGLGAFV